MAIRVFFDTEFTTLQRGVDQHLISVGMVAEDGREYYSEITDYPIHECSEFVRAVVLPLLDAPESKRLTRAAFDINALDWLASLGGSVELISDSWVDWQLLSAVFRDVSVGASWRLNARCLQHESEAALEVEYRFWRQIENQGKQHHALFDARCLKTVTLAMDQQRP